LAQLSATREVWPIRGSFRIARGAKNEAVVVVVEAREGDLVGRGEAVPYARYGETVEDVIATIESVPAGIETRKDLQEALPAGAARAAIDAALWELEARGKGERVWKLAGLKPPGPVATLRTISIDAPAAMAEAAQRVGASQLKLKLAGDGDDLARVEAVRRAMPCATLVADPNESWSVDDLARDGARLVELGVTTIEQPVPADADEGLADVKVPGLVVCADEAIHTRDELSRVVGRYDAINVKLGKTGGLTEALALTRRARALGLSVMVGCMVCTSLAIAPAFLLSHDADLFDLDGPLLLERDREGGAALQNGLLHPPTLWG
jgi:L-alanine-DL-glutamate epimerase-like enolase superfamily enzyme